MTGRIESRFAELKQKGRAALVTFVTAGDPDYETSLKIIKGLPKAGADIIEFGMPFTDPMADGPAIQAAGLRALHSGQTMKKTLKLVREFRAGDQETPVVLMGYYNPIYVYGVDRFLKDAKAAGVDGLIVVDLPPEEDDELCLPAFAADINFIRLATPTTDDKRAPTVFRNTSGFVYYVSVLGITGTKAPDLKSVEKNVNRLRKHTSLPIAVGFGVKTAVQARAIAKSADGVVVGSALVSAIKDSLTKAGKPSPKTVKAVHSLVSDIARGVRELDQVNWIKNFVRPKIRSILGVKRDVPENMWIKDPDSGQMVFYRDLEANQFVFPGSDHHHRLAPDLRLKSMFDDGVYETLEFPAVPPDPLKFRDERKYVDRLKEARQKSNSEDAIHAGFGTLDQLPIVIAVQDMGFIAGSLGTAAGEAIITAMRFAVSKKCPFVFFVASGGARMQEGILSLMQMPRTTVMVQELRAHKLPYIVVLTNPTTGGVTASYAMLGDFHIAEPKAQIGFAGTRVIEQTIREKLPEGFQRAEYLQDHGMVDLVVHRHQMRETVSRVARILMKSAELPGSNSGALVPISVE